MGLINYLTTDVITSVSLLTLGFVNLFMILWIRRLEKRIDEKR